jgi:pyruvate kinase
VADAVLIARGDLGVEVPIEEVPVIQKKIIKMARKYAKPVITATQMLESMISSPMPTRAEATDVANAIFDGTDAVMLSAETSVGKYPIETIKTMSRIIKRAEKALKSGEVPYYEKIMPMAGFTDAIGLATCELANTTSAKAIITSTESGRTAKLVAKYKPQAYIVAASPREETLRKLGIVWGTYPLYIPPFSSVDALLASIIDEAGAKGYLESGDVAVITAGDFVGVEGTTNLIKIATYTPVIARGIGIGSGFIVGRITRGETEGEVLVVDDIASIQQVDGRVKVILVKKKDFGVSANIPAGMPMVIGVGDAVDALKDGDLVSVDVYRGIVYGGQIIRTG